MGKTRADRRREAAAERHRPAGRSGPPGWFVAGAALLIALGAIGAILILGGHGTAGPVATVEGGSLRQGQAPPDFTATTFDGKRLQLSGLRGKVVLVNFFASWCTECRAEFADIEAAYRAHPDTFTVVGVNALDSGDGEGFYHQMGATFPAVADSTNGARPGPIASAYGVDQGLPVSVFVSKAGLVDQIYPGRIDAAVIRDELARLGAS